MTGKVSTSDNFATHGFDSAGNRNPNLPNGKLPHLSSQKLRPVQINEIKFAWLVLAGDELALRHGGLHF